MLPNFFGSRDSSSQAIERECISCPGIRLATSKSAGGRVSKNGTDGIDCIGAFDKSGKHGFNPPRKNENRMRLSDATQRVAAIAGRLRTT
jgi:hypothetical protein